MPRPRIGSVFPHGDHFDVQITLPDGARSRPMCLPAGTSEARAREIALRRTQLAAKEALPGVERKRKRKADVGPQGETINKWSERWLAARTASGLSSVDTDCGRLGKWVLPLVNDKAMADITRDDIERIVEHLDAAVKRADLAWKTAVNVWGLVSKMFKEACASKIRALRVRADNPAFGVPGPDRGSRKAKAYLYPTEFAALVACEAISLEWRRALAVSVYLYVRPGELRALRWEQDVDIARGTVHVHRSIDREGDAKTTKTGNTRRFIAEAALLPLLRAMHAEANGCGPVIELPDDRHLSRALRGMLAKAGVTRPELFATDATRKGLTWYDTRATGITWAAIRADDPLKIMQRAGHNAFATTQLYIREAESIRDGFGAVFPPLPASLLGQGGQSVNVHDADCATGQDRPPHCGESPGNCPDDTQVPEMSVEAPGIEHSTPRTDLHVTRSFPHGEPAATMQPTEANPAKLGAPGDTLAKPPSTATASTEAHASPRAALVAALAAGMQAALAVGDTEAAHVAHDAIGRLLGLAGGVMAGGAVVDLAAERARRS